MSDDFDKLWSAAQGTAQKPKPRPPAPADEFDSLWNEANPVAVETPDADFSDVKGGSSKGKPATLPKPASAPPAGTGRVLDRAGDVSLSALKGAIAVPEAAVGLASIVTGGRAGRVAGKLGFRPKEAREFLDDYMSEEQRAANKAVEDAKGVVGKTKAALSNPSTIAHAVVESAPLMLGGAGIARGIMRAIPRVGAVAAGAAGEGAVSAGASAEGVRQQTDDGLLTGKQAGVTAASGVATGLLGVFGGKVAKKLGIADVETLLAAGATSAVVQRGIVRQVVYGAVSEGFLEELPQSIQEQVANNIALNKPLTEGLDGAAVMGALAGAVMGGGTQVIDRAARGVFAEDISSAPANPANGLPTENGSDDDSDNGGGAPPSRGVFADALAQKGLEVAQAHANGQSIVPQVAPENSDDDGGGGTPEGGVTTGDTQAATGTDAEPAQDAAENERILAERRASGDLSLEEELDYAVEDGELTRQEADQKLAFNQYSDWRRNFKPTVKGDDVPSFDEWLVDAGGNDYAREILGRDPVDRETALDRPDAPEDTGTPGFDDLPALPTEPKGWQAPQAENTIGLDGQPIDGSKKTEPTFADQVARLPDDAPDWLKAGKPLHDQHPTPVGVKSGGVVYQSPSGEFSLRIGKTIHHDLNANTLNSVAWFRDSEGGDFGKMKDWKLWRERVVGKKAVTATVAPKKKLGKKNRQTTPAEDMTKVFLAASSESPWEMTQRNFQHSRAKSVGGVPALNANDKQVHEESVRTAVQMGLKVPQEVLSDYPALDLEMKRRILTTGRLPNGEKLKDFEAVMLRDKIRKLAREVTVPDEEAALRKEIGISDEATAAMRSLFSEQELAEAALVDKTHDYDTLEVRALTLRNDVRGQAAPELNDERKRLHARLEAELTDKFEPAQERKFFGIIGAMAVGKSAIANEIVSEHTARIIDQDDIKPALAEADGESVVLDYHHGEAGKIAEAVLRASIARGDNIVLPWSGSDLKATKIRLKAIKEAGYTVYLIKAEAESKKVAGRAVSRYYQHAAEGVAPRLARPAKVESSIPQIQGTFDALRNDKEFVNEAIEYDTNGKTPRRKDEGGNQRGSGARSPVDGSGDGRFRGDSDGHENAERSGRSGASDSGEVEGIHGVSSAVDESDQFVDLTQPEKKKRLGYRTRAERNQASSRAAEIDDTLVKAKPLPESRQHTHARDESGKYRKPHTVQTEGLITLLGELYQRRSLRMSDAQYKSVFDDDQAAVIPFTATRGKDGISHQAKAQKNIDDWTRIIERTEAHLLQTRGLTEHELSQAVFQSIHDEDARLEREGIQADKGDDSFDFGENDGKLSDDASGNPEPSTDNRKRLGGRGDVRTSTLNDESDRGRGGATPGSGDPLLESRDGEAQDTGVEAPKPQDAGKRPSGNGGYSEVDRASDTDLEDASDSTGYDAPLAAAHIAATSLNQSIGLAAPSAEVRSLIEISRTLANTVGVPLRQGRFNAALRQAAGVFFPHAETVRVVRWGDVPTVAHEVGHFISKKRLGNPTRKGASARGATPLPKSAVNELVQMGKNLYGSRKPNAGYGEEGVAEAFKFYVTDPARLAREAPTFLPILETVLNGEPILKDALEQARVDYAEHIRQPATARIDAQLSVGDRSRNMPTVDGMIRQFVDDLHHFRVVTQSLGGSEVQKNAYVLARLTRGDAGLAEEMNERGVIDFKTRQRVTAGIVPVLRSVPRKEMQAFRRYLVAQRHLELLGRGIKSGVDIQPDEATALVAEGDSRFRKPAEALWAHSNALLAFRRDAGLLTDSEYNLILAGNQRRVPFYRVFDEKKDNTKLGGRGKGWARNSSGVNAIKGSERDIIDPIEGVLQDTYTTVEHANRHFAVATLIDEALKTEGAGFVAEVVAAPKVRTEVEIERVTTQLIDLGIVDRKKVLRNVGGGLSVDTDAGVVDLEGVLYQYDARSFASAADRKDMVVPIVLGGKRKWIQIQDPLLFDAIEGMDVNLTKLPRWQEWFLAKPARMLRAGATLTGEFILRNPVRDFGSASIYTRSNRIRDTIPGAMFAKGFYEAVFGKRTGDSLYERWRLEGGDNAAMLALDREQLQKHIDHVTRNWVEKTKDIVVHPVDFLRLVSAATENATRVGEFNAVEKSELRKGKSRREAEVIAALASRDVTVDFAMAGLQGRSINQIVAFFNATLQGAVKLGVELRRRPQVIIPRALIQISLPSILLALSQWDDDEYQKIPLWQKSIFWIWVQRGDDGEVKHIWRIPKPFELGVLFGTGAEAVLALAMEHDSKRVKEWARSLIVNLVPPMPIALTAIMPAIEVILDRSLFTGRSIVPESEKRNPPGLRSRPQTGEFARQVGEVINISPAKIEHIVRGYTGGLGSYAMDVADVVVRESRRLGGRQPIKRADPGSEDRLAKVPGIKGFIVNPSGWSTQSIEDFYKAYNDASEKKQGYKTLREDGREKDAAAWYSKYGEEIRLVESGRYRQAYNALSKLRRERSAILRSEGDSERNRERLRALGDRAHEIAKQAMRSEKRGLAGRTLQKTGTE